VTVVRKQDRFVEPRLLRVALGQRRVHVVAGDLGAGRRDCVLCSAPRTHADAKSSVVIEVTAVRDRDDREALRDGVQTHPDVLGALEDDRAHVDAFLEAVAHAQLDRDIDQFVGRVRQRHEQDLGGDR